MKDDVIYMEPESIILSASITILALGMFIVAALSYKRFKNSKLIFVSSAFFIFFIKGVIQSLSIFLKEVSVIESSPYMKLFDLIILILLFTATLKR